ncbi:MAG TPA: hypothetical protein VG734_05530 [Lacunisphaera sp.]|nr:hypothetical protein [Lacunisphaera sp.]
MKFVFLSGGLLGFVTGLLTSWLLDHAADRVFLDGAIGCLAGALLFRWFWTVVLAGLRDTVLARHRASLAAAQAPSHPLKAK